MKEICNRSNTISKGSGTTRPKQGESIALKEVSKDTAGHRMNIKLHVANE